MNVLYIDNVTGFSEVGVWALLLGLILAIISLVVIVSSLAVQNSEMPQWLFVTFTVILSIIFIFSAIGTSYEYTKYYVILDETVSLSEISEKYEILETKGELYILTDRKE